jgi:hypothetical protein
MAVNNAAEAFHGKSGSLIIMLSVNDEEELTNLSLIVNDIVTRLKLGFFL